MSTGRRRLLPHVSDAGWVVAAGCVYELAAILSARVPTITTIIKHTGKHPVGRVFVWCWCGFVAWHFLEPD